MSDCFIPAETIRERDARVKREQRRKKLARRTKEIAEYPPHLWKPGFPGGNLAFRRELRDHAARAGGGSLAIVGTDVLRLLNLLDYHIDRHRIAAAALSRFAPSTAGFEEIEDLDWKAPITVTATAGAMREAFGVMRHIDRPDDDLSFGETHEEPGRAALSQGEA